MYEEDDNEDFASIMEEPPGGYNHGRKAVDIRVDDGRHERTIEHIRLDVDPARGFMRDGGWSVVWPGDGGTKGNPGGLVNHPSEYVDPDVIRGLALEEFGFTADEVAVYHRRGKPTAEETEIRTRMDARVLEIKRAGGNMFQFAEILGLTQRTMNRAFERAKARESE